MESRALASSSFNPLTNVLMRIQASTSTTALEKFSFQEVHPDIIWVLVLMQNQRTEF